MAIAFDSTGGHSGQIYNGSSPSSPQALSATVVTGRTALLLVVYTASGGSTPTTSSVTGGGTWSLVASDVESSGTKTRTELWATAAGAATAASSISVAYSGGAGTLVSVELSLAQYTGVGAVYINGSPGENVGIGTDLVQAVTTSAANSWVVGGFGAGGNATSGATAVSGNIRLNGGNTSIFMDNTAAGAGSVTSECTLTGSASWASAFVELLATPGVYCNAPYGVGAEGTSSPVNVSPTLFAIETAFCLVSFGDNSTVTATVTGITGGGTWTKVASADGFEAETNSELWSNFGATANYNGTVAVSWTGTAQQVVAQILSYDNVAQLVGSAYTGGGSTSTPITATCTNVTPNVLLIGGFSIFDGSVPTANTGTLRLVTHAASGATTMGCFIDLQATTAGTYAPAVTITGTHDYSYVFAQASVPIAPPDEDFWRHGGHGGQPVPFSGAVLPPPTAVPTNLPLNGRLLLPDPEEIPAGDLTSPIQDEDFWRLGPFPQPVQLPPITAFPAILPSVADDQDPAQPIFWVNGNTGSTTTTSVAITITGGIVGGTIFVVAFSADSAAPPYITSITDTNNNSYQRVGSFFDSTTASTEMWATGASQNNAAGSVTLTINTNAPHNLIVAVGMYGGIRSILNNTATNGASSTNPTIALTMQHGSDWVIAGLGGYLATTPTALTGNLREATSAGSSTSKGFIALNDNTASTAASVTNAITLATSVHASFAVEVSYLPFQPDEDFGAPRPPFPAPVILGLLCLPDPELVPAGDLSGQPDEDFLPVVPAPVAVVSLPLAPTDLGDILPPALPGDEDFGAPLPPFPPPVVVGPLLLPDPELLPAGDLAGQPDEDFQMSLPPPVPPGPPPGMPVDPGDGVPPLPGDEDFGSPLPPFTQPVTLGPLLLPDPELAPAGALAGQPDEDFGAPTPPFPAAVTMGPVYLPDTDATPTNTLSGQPDEDFGAIVPPRPAQPVLGPLYQPDPELVPAGDLFGQPDEDFGAPLPPFAQAVAMGTLYLPEHDETHAATLTGQPDEDFGAPLPPFSQPVTFGPLLLPDGDTQPAGDLFGQPDEDFGAPKPPFTQPTVFGGLYMPDGDTQPAGDLAGQPDEDFWATFPIPVGPPPPTPQPISDTDVPVKPPPAYDDFGLILQPVPPPWLDAPPFWIPFPNDGDFIGTPTVPGQYTVVVATPLPICTAVVWVSGVFDYQVDVAVSEVYSVEATAEGDDMAILGNTVRISTRFLNLGVLYDPTSFTLTITGQSAEIDIDPTTVVRDGVGLYHYDWVATITGNLVANFITNENGVEGSGFVKFPIYAQPTT